VNFYPRHLGDYASSASHLSILEHGVYNLLLDFYYATEKPIPAADVYRCSRARTKKEKAAVDSVLTQFFMLIDGEWWQKRAESEISKAQSKTQRNKKGFLQSYEWRVVRMKALLKYGAKCMACGATAESGSVINVDHIKPRKTHPELALDLDNLQVLCSDCNHGKGNWDCTDWRNK
jgi:uncharacterized protein YdaU (DUF1376 family)